MLIDVVKIATQEWQEFNGRDLEVLAQVSLKSAQASAEIAREMGHPDVADRIMERAGHP